MNTREANALNQLFHWAMSKPDHNGSPVTGEQATEAARYLAGQAYKALAAGATPEGVDLSRVLPVDLGDGDTAFALQESLEAWGWAQADKIVFEGGNEKRLRWSEAAARLLQSARAVLR